MYRQVLQNYQLVNHFSNSLSPSFTKETYKIFEVDNFAVGKPGRSGPPGAQQRLHETCPGFIEVAARHNPRLVDTAPLASTNQLI